MAWATARLAAARRLARGQGRGDVGAAVLEHVGEDGGEGRLSRLQSRPDAGQRGGGDEVLRDCHRQRPEVEDRVIPARLMRWSEITGDYSDTA